MSKKERKIFKKAPTLAPKITLNSKLVSWRQNESKASLTQHFSAFTDLFSRSILSDSFNSLPLEQVTLHNISRTPRSSIARLKNFCYFVGRSRSYCRDYQMSRHVMRKFVRFGMLPGLVKERC